MTGWLHPAKLRADGGAAGAGLGAMTSIDNATRQEREEVRNGGQPWELSDSGILFGHELRTCLHSILLSAEVLSLPDTCADPALCGRQLDAIRSAVAYAEDLLSRTLVTVKPLPQAGMVPLQTVFEAVRKEIEGRARTSGVTLTFPKVLPRWSVDSFVARLALSNLLVNAIKYSDATKPDRWVTVRVEPAADDEAALVLEVADNGLGIPADLQQWVFLRSFRAHPHVAEGTGLGLALTRERVVDQGGSIHLFSDVGIGTTVRVTLLRGR